MTVFDGNVNQTHAGTGTAQPAAREAPTNTIERKFLITNKTPTYQISNKYSPAG